MKLFTALACAALLASPAPSRLAPRPSAESPAPGAFLGVRALPAEGGMRIEELVEGGPADRAGLRVGDVVTALAGEPVRADAELRARLAVLEPGSAAPVRFLRGGVAAVLPVALGAPPQEESREPVTPARRPAPETAPASPRGYLGVYVEDDPRGGVRVSGLAADGPAWRAGLRSGDRLLALDGDPLESSDALLERLAPRRPGERVELQLERGGRRRGVALVLAPRTGLDAVPPPEQDARRAELDRLARAWRERSAAREEALAAAVDELRRRLAALDQEARDERIRLESSLDALAVGAELAAPADGLRRRAREAETRWSERRTRLEGHLRELGERPRAVPDPDVGTSSRPSGPGELPLERVQSEVEDLRAELRTLRALLRAVREPR